MTEPLTIIGRVVKPHGIRGEVAVEVLSDVPNRFDAGVVVVVGGRSRRVAASRPHQGRMLVSFDGVTDRSAAEHLRGHPVEAEAVDLGDTDTYFAHELVGVAVMSDDGRDLGVVGALIELPSAAGYDLLEIHRQDGSTWLLPAVEEYVEVRDDDHGTLQLWVIDPPPGLIEADVTAQVDAQQAAEPDGMDGGDAVRPSIGRDEVS